jgi:hypothetical protein
VSAGGTTYALVQRTFDPQGRLGRDRRDEEQREGNYVNR